MKKTLLIIIVAVGLAQLAGARHMTADARQADAAMSSILGAIAAGRAGTVYHHNTTGEFRGAMPLANWRRTTEQIREMGELRDVDRTRGDVRYGEGQIVGEFAYDVQWGSGGGEISVNMRKESDGWKLLSIDFRREG